MIVMRNKQRVPLETACGHIEMVEGPMRYVLIGIAMMVFLVVSLAGFRGDISLKPFGVFVDMDRQPKFVRWNQIVFLLMV